MSLGHWRSPKAKSKSTAADPPASGCGNLLNRSLIIGAGGSAIVTVT
jgi:hypothetical protein